MKKLLLFKKTLSVVFVAIAVIGGWLLMRAPQSIPKGIEIGVVTKGDVVEVVSETGFVLPAQSIDLSYERGGKVVEIPVQEGDLVKEGDVLMRLDQAQLQTDLTAARARVEAERIRLAELQNGADDNSLAVTGASVGTAEAAVENARQNLKEITAQHDQLVENALKALRSSNLQAYLVSNADVSSLYTYDAPIISGTYDSSVEGVYHLSLYRSAAPSGASLRVSGLETDTAAVSVAHPVAIGTRGLYAQFPEDFAWNTEWEIPVPNTRSSNYLANLNTYNAVVDARTVAIMNATNLLRSAEASLDHTEAQYTQVMEPARAERIRAQEAMVTQARSAAELAEILYEAALIRAPFAGTITKVTPEVGEIITPSAPVVSMITTDTFDIVVNVSESDIKEVSPGDTATIEFDAYEDLKLTGTVTHIAPNAVVVDGVRVFEVRLQFAENEEFIRPGLSADVDITTARRTNVIAVPSRSVVEREDSRYVRKFEGGIVVYLPVKIGLRGSNGMTEILEGLSEGQTIISFANGDALRLLEENGS